MPGARPALALLALSACVALAHAESGGAPDTGCAVSTPQLFSVLPMDGGRTRYGAVQCAARVALTAGWTDCWHVTVIGVRDTGLVYTPATMRVDSAVVSARMQARDVALDMIALDHATRCDSIIATPLPPGVVHRFCA